MNAQIQNWDNLHLVLAISQGGGLSGAARLMGVHHSTALRRLNMLEHQIGVRLFERSPGGYRPTVDGEELAAIAAETEQQVMDAFRRVAGKDLRLSGTLRIATTEYLATTILPDILRSFRDAYPDIELEVTLSARLASLTKRDADIALRPTNDPPENLKGRRVCSLSFDVYCARELLDKDPNCAMPGQTSSPMPPSVETLDLDWITVDDTISHSSTYRWREQFFPNTTATTRFDTMLGIFDAAKAGMGIAILPCYMADPEPALVRIKNSAPELEIDLWLLTHPDLYRTQRVRVFLQHAAAKITAWHGSLGASPL